MLMVSAAHHWTADDLDWITDEERRYEVVNGELFVTPSPSRDHQSLAGQLYARLFAFVRMHGIGSVFFAPADMHVDDRNRVQPDIFVEPPTPGARPASWRDAPIPILTIEILSEATAERDRGPKRSLYLRAGVAEYWVVEAASRSVRVVRTGQPDSVVSDALRWLPRGAAEPLVIDLPKLFRDALEG